MSQPLTDQQVLDHNLTPQELRAYELAKSELSKPTHPLREKGGILDPRGRYMIEAEREQSHE